MVTSDGFFDIIFHNPSLDDGENYETSLDDQCRSASDIEEIRIRGLWRAVIMQALVDAASNSRKRQAKLYKIRALKWLEGDSEDFLSVCVMADMEPNHVKEQARMALQRGCKWRNDSRKLSAIHFENKLNT